MGATTVTAQRAVLEAFDREIGRETHSLRSRPDVLWQQLYNRLQWEDEPLTRILEPELRRRAEPGHPLWLHLRTPPRESEALIRTLADHTDGVLTCAFSPEGQRIVSGSIDKTLKLWDVQTGRCEATLEGHTADVYGCVFSPDGTTIASASNDETLRLWDAETGRERLIMASHKGRVTDCAFSPDGVTVASASDDTTLKLWEAAGGIERGTLKAGRTVVWACAFAPDGKTICSASWDGVLMLWDAARGERRAILRGHKGPVFDCTFSPDGELVVSAGRDGSLMLWDAARGKRCATLKGHAGGTTACAFSPDGKTIASAGEDKTVRLWDVGTGTECGILEGHTDKVIDCAFSPDGATVVSASLDRTLKLWDARTRSQSSAPKRHDDRVEDCAFSPDGKTVLSASDDTTLKLWDASTSLEQATLRGHADKVWACAFSPDGRTIVSASTDKTVRLWSSSGEPKRVGRGHTGKVFACAFSPDGRNFVSGSLDRTLKLWDAETGKCWATLKGHGDTVTACAFSPDGRNIVSASGDKTLKLWDVEAGVCKATLEGHDRRVEACAFSPDGRAIVSGGFDKTLRLWSTASGAELAMFTAPGDVPACAFSPFGDLVCCTDEGGGVYMLALSGAVAAVALHPSAPMVAGADAGGGVCLAHLVGHSQRSIVVTAVDLGKGIGYQVRCPFCNRYSDLQPEWLGTDIGCPHCAKPLRVNPFTVPPKNTREVPCLRVAGPEGPMVTEGMVLVGHEGEVSFVSVARDAPVAISGSLDGTARVWDTGTGACLHVLRPGAGPLLAVAVSFDGARGVTVAEGDGRVAFHLWNLRLGTLERLLGGDYHSPRVRLSADLAVAVVADGDALRVVDLVESRELFAATLADAGPITTLAISPDAVWVALGTADGMLALWECATDTPREVLRGRLGAAARAVEVGGDGRRVYSADDDCRIWAWEPGAPRAALSFAGCSEPVAGLSVTPDGRLLASASTDRTIRVWDAASGSQVWGTEIGETATALALTAAGDRLVAGFGSGEVRVFDVTPKGARTPWVFDGNV